MVCISSSTKQEPGIAMPYCQPEGDGWPIGVEGGAVVQWGKQTTCGVVVAQAGMCRALVGCVQLRKAVAVTVARRA